MSHYVYWTPEYEPALQAAHSAIWEEAGTTALDISDQISGWKRRYNVNIKGGPFDSDWSPDRGQRPILLEFESKESFMLFLLEWS